MIGGQIVAAAKEFIFKHFSKDLTLGEIAWHVGKGEEHLARVFKSETGQSVFDYVRETRINQAKTLMMNPVGSLTEIAERCGFHTLSFFSRTFRQHSGMSPSHYRHSIETKMS
jgi:AraC-like DNA-binding protein